MRLGNLVLRPIIDAPQNTAILELDSARGGGRADQWHSDVTIAKAYPKISILRGVVIPESRGKTIWSNTAAAYLDLPAPLQKFADGLWAVHTNAFDYPVKSRATEADRKHFKEVFTGAVCETEHPVVRVHPETGERVLVLGNCVQRFVGLQKCTGQKLFEIFQSYIMAPENTVRWNWKAGDVAIWDNRATQHYAINDYGDQYCVVRRAAIDGGVPLSVDGRRSVGHQNPLARGRQKRLDPGPPLDVMRMEAMTRILRAQQLAARHSKGLKSGINVGPGR